MYSDHFAQKLGFELSVPCAKLELGQILVLTAVTMEGSIFWDVIPYGPIEVR